MPRYFFHVRNGDKYEKDPEGAEFDSLEEARRDAEMAAREILAEKILRDDVIDGHGFEVTTEQGEVAFFVPFKSVLRLE